MKHPDTAIPDSWTGRICNVTTMLRGVTFMADPSSFYMVDEETDRVWRFHEGHDGTVRFGLPPE